MMGVYSQPTGCTKLFGCFGLLVLGFLGFTFLGLNLPKWLVDFGKPVQEDSGSVSDSVDDEGSGTLSEFGPKTEKTEKAGSETKPSLQPDQSARYTKEEHMIAYALYEAGMLAIHSADRRFGEGNDTPARKQHYDRVRTANRKQVLKRLNLDEKKAEAIEEKVVTARGIQGEPPKTFTMKDVLAKLPPNPQQSNSSSKIVKFVSTASVVEKSEDLAQLKANKPTQGRLVKAFVGQTARLLKSSNDQQSHQVLILDGSEKGFVGWIGSQHIVPLDADENEEENQSTP